MSELEQHLQRRTECRMITQANVWRYETELSEEASRKFHQIASRRMTSTSLLAARCASRVDAPIPPEVWVAFINAAVALLMGCFADTSKAAAELERQRVGVIGRWRLRRAAKHAGIAPECREAAIMVLLDESSRATPGELGALYHDALTAGVETGEFPAVKA